MTSNNELSKTYSPTEFEEEIYAWWEKNGYYKPEKQRKLGITDENKEAFSTTIPPPNVTGVLHLGHAIIISIQDLMIRYERMRGKETLFVPGTDHAGIATQNVVERELDKKGIKRKEIGRKKFVEEVWKWKEISHATIVKQSKKMGMSSDWDRERFTMDEQLSKAVRKAFVTLYEQDLIYRGSYLINWCSGRCESAISSLEAIPEEVNGHLWYLKYPVISKNWKGPTHEWGSGKWAEGAEIFIEIATTRPETLLGDTAIATSKNHNVFGKLIGNEVVIPVVNRYVKIIEDEHVDAEFGTGALKITPAHDFNDYEIGKRHGLEFITMLDEKSRIETLGGKYAGMDRFECRTEIVKDLEKEGLLNKVEDHPHSIPHCERCHTIVEPRDSIQWFVKVKPLADKVLALMKKEKVTFIPSKFDTIFKNWMENLHDWCISRQLWWGHRIPIWYCECGEKTTGIEDPSNCASCGSDKITQDEDVLDTWFSSGLWPFSTLGWPENTSDMKRFYPNSVRETGYDILSFWVAREMMFGAILTDTLPYHTIYFHGLIRNEAGRKISKSMENIEDYNPLKIIDKYGADTLRYTLITYSTPGLDMNLDPKNIEATHKFGNKIWQATKFLLGNLPEKYDGIDISSLNYDSLELSDKWILSQLNKLIRDYTEYFNNYDYLNAGRLLKKFFWNIFADWYIEITKLRIYDTDKNKFNPVHILLHILDNTMRLLHPIMPFITEKLWQALPDYFHDQDSLIIAKWPETDVSLINDEIDDQFDLIIKLIISIRRIRNEFKVKPSKKISLLINAGSKTNILKMVSGEIAKLGLVDEDKLIIENKIDPPKKVVSDIIDDLTIYIPLEGLIEIEEEVARLEKEIIKISKLMKKVEGKLNSDFVKRAPANIVELEKEKLQKYKNNITKIEDQKKSLLA